MLYWKANFSIPNSHVQSAEVFVSVNENEVRYYCSSDLQDSHLLYSKNMAIPRGIDPYQYLLSLEEFNQYERI